MSNRIHVAKIAPKQPVQEQLISAGLRFDPTGHLLPYSILGSVNEYTAELSEIEAAEVSLKKQALIKLSIFSQISSTNKDKKDDEDVPEIGTYDQKAKRPTGSPDGGGRSLQNWKFRMDERRQVMKNMSSKKSSEILLFNFLSIFIEELKRSPATLLMNQTDRWRERKELLDLMDATLPLLQNGKNWRLHSEFWTQQQLIGDDDVGIQ